ncbi:flavodoxin family protein [Olsenella profusa]|uniref:NAD(P)H-dependent oxidoreductase n=1 Tax=Olsenella profusa TaxID=138595 RepID=A0ABS2F102_9ACTN|nr:flavodoxin [Olsenella profusa]MBM6774237.1 NAD(P)H-dependent oxidoreductase [Olsenella profusa]
MMTRRNFLAGAATVAMAALAGCTSDAPEPETDAPAPEEQEAAPETPATADEPATDELTADAPASGATLVAYFSATGNTAGVAQAIAERLGADTFELVPTDPYTDDDLDYNVAKAGVNPCAGCVACGYGARPCVQHDGMERVLDAVLAADMLVLATPLYYYGMTAQLKTVIDRFCSANSDISARHLKAALLTVAWNADDWTFDALVSHYETLCRYLSMSDCGKVLGYGCGTPGMTRHTDAPRQAFELGASL